MQDVSLSHLLKHFDPSAVQRSLSYVTKVKMSELEMEDSNGDIFINAPVKGTSNYHTKIKYDSQTQRIVQSHCSCPVGSFCKHGAALARVFKQQYLSKKFKQPLSQSSNPTPKNSEVQHWLRQLKYILEDLTEDNQVEVTTSPLIYILKQEQKSLKLRVNKYIKINTNNEFMGIKDYTSYENIVNEKIKMPTLERNLFTQLYGYSQVRQKS